MALNKREITNNINTKMPKPKRNCSLVSISNLLDDSNRHVNDSHYDVDGSNRAENTPDQIVEKSDYHIRDSNRDIDASERVLVILNPSPVPPPPEPPPLRQFSLWYNHFKCLHNKDTREREYVQTTACLQ